MAKLVVIDVDLGINLDQIILESAKELTQSAKEELDVAITTAESARRLKDEKVSSKQNNEDAIATVLNIAYDKLKNNLSTGVPVTEILSLIIPNIPNSSAFALRMKKLLSSKGNPYRLSRSVIDNVPYYLFTKFNEN